MRGLEGLTFRTSTTNKITHTHLSAPKPFPHGTPPERPAPGPAQSMTGFSASSWSVRSRTILGRLPTSLRYPSSRQVLGGGLLWCVVVGFDSLQESSFPFVS